MKAKLKILIGYDGSKGADIAIQDLKRAGLPREADAWVLSAADVFLPMDRKAKIPASLQPSIKRARAAAVNELRHAEKLAHEAIRKIKSIFPAWNIKSEACADSPAWALVKKADSWGADLVVVGAHGHSQWGRFLGSVSQMVLTQANCSVRVGRAAVKSKTSALRLVMGIDGSPDSALAVQTVMKRQWPTNTEFLMLSVIDPKKSTFLDRYAPAEIRWYLEKANNERRVVGKMLESLAIPFRKKYRHVRCEIKEGDPKRVLVNEAASWGADCIFVGERGLTHMKRIFMGGVSTSVAARAGCSVEVVSS